MDIIKESLGLISISSPWTWGSLGIVGVLTLPLTLFCLDQITQFISDLIVKCNNLVFRRLPIPFLRKWLENKQVDMLQRSIETYKATILKIRR